MHLQVNLFCLVQLFIGVAEATFSCAAFYWVPLLVSVEDRQERNKENRLGAFIGVGRRPTRKKQRE